MRRHVEIVNRRRVFGLLRKGRGIVNYDDNDARISMSSLRIVDTRPIRWLVWTHSSEFVAGILRPRTLVPGTSAQLAIEAEAIRSVLYLIRQRISQSREYMSGVLLNQLDLRSRQLRTPPLRQTLADEATLH